MAKLTSILNDRFLKKDKTKTGLLAEQSNQGTLTSFSGIFGLAKLDEKEKERLEDLLKKFAPEEEVDLGADLSSLVAITSEVKAIQSQAVMLHGERIKKAQEILKKYRDGAFTSWLIETYGNRQTPYNFLQYYEFYLKLPSPLKTQVETMPRQAVYTLASREGQLERKEEIVRTYKGETKEELLTLIRSYFPLDEKDRRREDCGENAIALLRKALFLFEKKRDKLSKQQKATLLKLLASLKEHISHE